jgi:hypothetical protein
MMLIETPLSSGPKNERYENECRDCPVSQSPIDDLHQFQGHPSGEFPDYVHMTTSEKSGSRTSQESI